MGMTTTQYEIMVKGNAVTRTDEHGNVTVWELRSECRRGPRRPNGERPYLFDAWSTVNGANGRAVVVDLPASVVLAWHMGRL